ncbi:MAG: hypothetical protein KA534_01765 [Sediminibacterium sp.]|nr:hypothetical protein [Sediminibacterium sp.]MBP6144307.1 hypothetical protein [Sediminibacterium sp.]
MKTAHRRNPLLPKYEHKSEPLATSSVYLKRILINLAWTTVVLFVSLSIGVVGYKYLAPMSWIDALHNASMILSGMGPVVVIQTNTGKLFSSFYALFSGVVFITNIGILIAPVAHRFFHKMNLED